MGERHQKSIMNLVRILESYIETPSSFAENKKFLTSFSSQGSLARYKSDDFGVESMSLNTMKEECRFLPQGFFTLDVLRKSAKAALLVQKISSGVVKQKAKVPRDYKEQIKILEQEIMRLTGFNYELRTLCYQLATSKFTDVHEYYRKRIAEITLMTPK